MVTAHGRDPRTGPERLPGAALVAVLTAPGAGAAELGAGLIGWSRRLLVAEHLGTAAERIRAVTPEQAAAETWADPHVLLSLADPVRRSRRRAYGRPPTPAAAPLPGLGRRDARRQPARRRPGRRLGAAGDPVRPPRLHDHQVGGARPRRRPAAPPTGPADLGRRRGQRVGGIECALLGAAVLAVEQDPAAGAEHPGQCRRPRRARPAGHRSSPAALAGLPEPDAVFVGGGGVDVLAAVVARQPERVVLTLAALDRVAPAVGLLRAAGYRSRAVSSPPPASPTCPAGRSASRPPTRWSSSPGSAREPPEPARPDRSGGGHRRRPPARRHPDRRLAARPAGEAESVADALRTAWAECDAVVAFLATGAAVRILAPLLADKAPTRRWWSSTRRPARRGAARRARRRRQRARRAGGRGAGRPPVITTATDAVDLPGLDTLGWPVEGAVAAVSRAILDGEPVG